MYEDIGLFTGPTSFIHVVIHLDLADLKSHPHPNLIQCEEDSDIKGKTVPLKFAPPRPKLFQVAQPD